MPIGGRGPDWRNAGRISAAAAESNPACGASPKPPPALLERAPLEYAVSGVPAAVSRGGAAGFPDFPRDARGFGESAAPFDAPLRATVLEPVLDFGARAIPRNMARPGGGGKVGVGEASVLENGQAEPTSP